MIALRACGCNAARQSRVHQGETDVRSRSFVTARSLTPWARAWRRGRASGLVRAGVLGLKLGVGVALALGAAPGARAQEIEPYEFVPLPAGTNLAIGYYVYGHQTQFNVARGSTIKNSGLEVNVGVARYVHFVEIGGHPAGFQVLQNFGSLSAGHIDGQSLGSVFGAQQTTLSAFIWPYVNTASKTNVNTTVFLYPPLGTYDGRRALNIGDNRWKGAIQLGLSQGIGDRFAFDADVDATFYGDNASYVPGFRRLSQDPTYRVQFWGNYRWSPGFTTSLGYEGLFGGDEQVNSRFNGSKTEVQRIRANAALFLSPRLQTMIEVNHDVHVTGGFRQEIGATLRVVYVF